MIDFMLLTLERRFDRIGMVHTPPTYDWRCIR